MRRPKFPKVKENKLIDTYVTRTRVRETDTGVYLRVGHLKLEHRAFVDIHPNLDRDMGIS